MNKYLKSFLTRGAVFAGFGPVVMGIVYAILNRTIENFSLGGGEVFLAIISTYLLAFIQAGASVFNQIEDWPLAKSLLFHFGTLYVGYLGFYALNRWIPFEISVVLIFTAIFAVCYFAIWITVFLITKATAKKLNKKITDNPKTGVN